MKPSTATFLGVAALLAAAMLCPVLVPHTSDDKTSIRGDESPQSAPSSSKRMDSPDNDPITAREAMTRRVRSRLLNPNWMERSRNLLLLTETLRPGEWPLAMASLHELGMSRNGEEEILLMTAWTEVDPRAAAEYSKSSLSSVIPMWMSLDPKAAWDWIMSQDEAERPGLVGSALGALVETDLPRVTRELTAMKQRAGILPNIARRIACKEEGSSRRWLDSISDPKMKDEALVELLKQLPKSRINEKFELAQDHPEKRQRIMRELYQSWAGVDEAAALASFENLEPGPEWNLALAGIVDHLLQRDPVRALDFMDRHPGPGQDQVLRQWIYYVVDNEPALAIGQIHRFAKPEHREDAYRRVLTTWLEKDGTAAREWLSTHDLPASLKQEFKPD
ncbi:MAG TPA: hypothetical protein VGE67_02100 [Haloferula sp.]